MRHLRRLLAPFCLLGVGALTWLALSRPPPPATWLSVTAPRFAVAGQTITIRVDPRVAESPAPALLAVDLHWSTTHRESRGVLSAATPQAISPPGSTLVFHLPVPPRDELGYVHAIIYLSPTGNWEDRTIAAASDEIHVVSANATIPEPAAQALRVFTQVAGPPVVRRDAPAMRWLLAAGWLAFVAWWWARRSDHRMLIAASGAIAAAWELLPLEDTLGEQARAFAVAHRWYDLRVGYQQFLTVAIVVGTAALIIVMSRRAPDRGHLFARLGLALYGGTTLAGFLSLHTVDALFATTVFEIPLLQIVQLVAVLVALAGASSAEPKRQTRQKL